MAVQDPYASVAEYRDQYGKTSTDNTAAIERALLAASRHLDQRLGRHFTKDAAATARIFYPVGKRTSTTYTRSDWAESENPWLHGGLARVLDIDDLVSLTSILIDTDRDGSFADETALVSADYQLHPRNAASGSEPRPYTAIALTTWGSVAGFTPGCQVQVTGVWGWPSVPAAIKVATLELAALQRLETPRATRTVTEMGQSSGTTRSANDVIETLIRDGYKRVRV